MKPVFVDTSYYLAYLNETDECHDKAIEIGGAILGKMVVTEYVFVELGNALSRSSDRKIFVPYVHEILNDPLTVFVPASQSLFHDGLSLYDSRQDKNWSLVDCISFVVMKQKRLREALTTDHHFEQAGFVALLR